MTANELARLLQARRIGKGKWVARCPGHPDHKPSLAIAEGRKGVLLKCMSNGCETRDILRALGLTWCDLFASTKMTPALRRVLGNEALKENLERQLGLVIWLGAIERGPYWRAAEKRIRRELGVVRCRIEPEKIYQEFRGRLWCRMNQRQRERTLEQAYERFIDT